MDEDSVEGVYFYEGPPPVDGVYRDIADGKPYPACMVPALVIFGLLCLLVGSIFA